MPLSFIMTQPTIVSCRINQDKIVPVRAFGGIGENLSAVYYRIAAAVYQNQSATVEDEKPVKVALFVIRKGILQKQWQQLSHEVAHYDSVLIAVEFSCTYHDLKQKILNHDRIRFVWRTSEERFISPILHKTLNNNNSIEKEPPLLHESIDVEELLDNVTKHLSKNYQTVCIGFCTDELVLTHDLRGEKRTFSRREGVIGALSYVAETSKLDRGLSEELNDVFAVEGENKETAWYNVPLKKGSIFALVLGSTSGPREHEVIQNNMRIHFGILELISATYIKWHLSILSLNPHDLYRNEVVKKIVRPASKYSDPIGVNSRWALPGIGIILSIMLTCFTISFFVHVSKYAPGYGIIQDSSVTKLISPETGIVESILKDSGDMVKTNTTLLKLVNQQHVAERQSALQELQDLKIRRLRNQFQASDASRYDYLTSKLKQIDLLGSAYEIKAGTDGQLSEIYVREGDYIQAGQKVMYIKSSHSGNTLQFAIAAHNLPDLNIGDIVTVRLPTLPDDFVSAKVTNIRRQALSKRETLQALDIDELNVTDSTGSYILLSAGFLNSEKQSITQYLVNGYQGPVKLSLKDVPLIVRLFPRLEKLGLW